VYKEGAFSFAALRVDPTGFALGFAHQSDRLGSIIQVVGKQ
jgi:hypothetical protein